VSRAVLGGVVQCCVIVVVRAERARKSGLVLFGVCVLCLMMRLRMGRGDVESSASVCG
jgi:hypothetical protein